MKAPRFLSVTKRIFLDLRNDRRTLALIFLAPVFAMLVFGLAFSGSVKNVRVEIVNKDQGAPGPFAGFSVADRVIANLDKKVLDLHYSKTREEGLAKVKDGQAYAVIYFPPDLTSGVLATKQGEQPVPQPEVELYLDESNVNVAAAITSQLTQALLKTAEQAGIKPPVTVSTTAVYGKNARFIDFFVPGIMAFAVFQLTTLLTLVSFVGERTGGTLFRMLATPLRERDIVAGYAAAFSVVGTVQSAILLLVGIVVFHIIIVGNVMLAFLIIALLAVVSQALGILLSSLARREAQVIQFLPFIILPSLLLAGVFWPLEAIPTWLRPLSYLVPPTYAVAACRAVMLKGWGIGQVWVDIVALLAFAVAFLVLATESLKARRA